MVAGRLRWLGGKEKPPGRIALALLEFDSGTLVVTEAGTKRRASLHLVEGEAALRAMDPGGLEIAKLDLQSFSSQLKKENHTLKRALADPHLFAGIGNAYSDEILHRARLSPVALTSSLSDGEVERLFVETKATLQDWTQRLRTEAKRPVPGESHRLPRGHGGSWPLRQALPRLRLARAAHPLRRQRNQLLCPLPDRRQAAGRPVAVAPAEEELAPLHRRVGVAR
jgi:ribosomal protein S13